MAELSWRFAYNPFLNVTSGRRPLMLKIGADHTARLAGRLGSPADVDIQACIDRVQPLFDAFQLAMVTCDMAAGTRKGQTEILEELLDELSRERIRRWDVSVQNIYLQGTPQYTQIFPKGRAPFQRGGREQRILAVQTLAQRLAAFPDFASLRSTIEAFHTSLESARNTQQGTESEISAASVEAEAARVALAIGMYANVGRLMEKHAADPDRLGDYFEIALLRSSGSSGTDPDDQPPLDPPIDEPTA